MMRSQCTEFLFVILLFATTLTSLLAQIPCDDAYGTHCPEESGWGVGICLKKIADLSEGCKEYIRLQDACRTDIEQHCNGKEYSSDSLLCLTEWTKDVNLSDTCIAALPKKQEQQKAAREADKLGSDAKRKADQRRR